MLERLFKPRSVAVIGASAKELNIGNRIVRNLVEFGYRGRVYPINAKVNDIYGLKAYGTILDVPGDVDVVHMAIAAPHVPKAIEECGSKGVKHVILNGGGFSETGPAGAAIEEQCIVRAKESGIRIFGPNCQGIINTDPDVRAYCNFTFTMPKEGSVSILALSGGVASLLHQTLHDMGVGTRMYASNGNACDISIPEILRYFGEDEGTKVIVLYVEGLKDPRGFMEIARKVVAKKPVLVMKAGRTEEGARAAASHTGGLARTDTTADVIFEKAGLICFHDEVELCQAAAAFASQPIPKGRRVGMITNTGGPAVIATDALVRGRLTLPALSPRTEEILKHSLFQEATVSNPVDVLATGTADHFRTAVDAMMDDEGIDSVMVNFVTAPFVDTDSIARELVSAGERRRKPLVCNLMTDKAKWQETVRILKNGDVLCYDFPGTAAKMLAALTRYGEILDRKDEKAKILADTDRQQALAIAGAARAEGRSALTAGEVWAILGAYAIPVAPWRVAETPEEASCLSADLGFPVVLKADSTSIVHKSDVGAIVLGIEDEKSVLEKARSMTRMLGKPDLKFLVQKHLPGGQEIIVGGKEADEAGHLVMVGLGGVYVDIFKDVSFKLAPVTETEAHEMLSSLKAAPLIRGARGGKGVDEAAIIAIIRRVSQLVSDLPMIREMDLNPVIVYEDGAVVVDARIRL